MFQDQILSFSENMNNLRDFVDMVSTFLQDEAKKEITANSDNLAPLVLALNKLAPDEFDLAEEEITSIEEKIDKEVDIKLIEDKENGDVIKFEIDSKGNKNFQKAIKAFKADHHRRVALYNNALISLISSVEWFLAQVIHQHFRKNPRIISSKEKQFSLEELSNFDSIDDAKDYLIEKTVESVLRGSIDDWFNFLKSKLKLSMGYVDEYYPKLVEATQRRNLLIHNGGKVNRIYLSKYPKSLGECPNIGEDIFVLPDYLSETIAIFEQNFLLIAAELWKKVGAKNKERGSLLVNLSYDHLLSGRYDVAQSLSYFAAHDKSLLEVDRLYAQINYWIAKKFGGEFESVQSEIEKEDFSAKSRLFILAQNILLDRFEDAVDDIDFLIQHDSDFSLETVTTWPLFKEFREHEIYNDFIDKYLNEEIGLNQVDIVDTVDTEI